MFAMTITSSPLDDGSGGEKTNQTRSLHTNAGGINTVETPSESGDIRVLYKDLADDGGEDVTSLGVPKLR
jgi:hypothetical protein